MSASAFSQSGYSESARTLGTPRSIEARVFSRVTGSMARASADEESFPLLVVAIHENMSLWTTLVADVVDSRNTLPPTLRAQIVYLGEFTAAHSQKVLRREADVSPLIEINTAILRGLRGQQLS